MPFFLTAIAIRRIGHTPESIAEAISCTDLDTLNSEHCELLLKFIPTKEEVQREEGGGVFESLSLPDRGLR
jgi:hypothetical protein